VDTKVSRQDGEPSGKSSPMASSPLMLHGGFFGCPLKGPGKVLNGGFNDSIKVLKVFLFECWELVMLAVDIVIVRI